MYDDWKPEPVRDEIEREITRGIPNSTVVVTPSVMEGSEVNYVAIFLSAAKYDGPHIFLHPDDLDDNPGIVVSRYEGDEQIVVEEVASVTAALDWLRNELAS